MKKNNYFIITSIINILLAIFSLINIQEVSNELIASFESVKTLINTNILDIIKNNSYFFIIDINVIVILTNILLFIHAKNDKIISHKGLLITLSIISFFISTDFYIQVLSLINTFVLISIKRENKEIKPLPILPYFKPSKKDIILGISYLTLYILGHYLVKFIPNIRNIAIIYEISFYSLMFILAFLIFGKEIKRVYNVFIDNFKTYLKFIFKNYAITYLFLFIAGAIVYLVLGNQRSLNEQELDKVPLYLLAPLAIIWAPIVEETLFRGVLRRIIKSDKWFIVVSAITFGLLHTISEKTVLEVIIMALPYSVLGGFLAYLYVKTNNILVNITTHSIQNTLSVILKLFM